MDVWRVDWWDADEVVKMAARWEYDRVDAKVVLKVDGLADLSAD